LSVSTVKKSQGEHACGLLAQELLPARADPPRRRLYSRGEENPPDRARGDGDAELEQLAGNARVARARVLARETQHEHADVRLDRRSAGAGEPAASLGANELRCQRSRVSGVTNNPRRRGCWSSRVRAAPERGSAGRSFARLVWRRSTAS
jgi:hypothetical protein